MRKTQEQYLEEVSIVHNNYYTYTRTNYVKGSGKIIITCPTHGDFTQRASNHLLGVGCKYCGIKKSANSKVKSETEVRKEFTEKHKDLFEYDFTNYIDKKSEITIRCKKHNEEFKQTPYNHLKGYGCYKCSTESYSTKRTKTTKKFVEESNSKHSNEYLYPRTVYKRVGENVIITCKTHGDFKQTPDNHLHGKGCPDCALENKGYSKVDYIKQAKGREGTMYLIKCYNESEIFYKIGRTFQGVKKRFSGSNSIPYNYEITYEYKSDAGTIWDLEREYHRKYKGYKYKPKIGFAGQTE